MNDSLSNQWFDPLLRTEPMRRVFSDRGRLQGILDFEVALARAEAAARVIPEAAAKTIASQCRAELFDIAAFAEASAAAGNSAIPVIKELTRLVAAADASAAGYVHWGATSQDAMDTGLVLQMRQGLDLIERDARQLALALARLAANYKETPIVGRTWLQAAAPTTFGLKVAGWLDAVNRCRQRLHDLRPRALVLQFGGAVGTLAALGDNAERTTALLAQELNLEAAAVPWHAQRDRLVEVAAALGLLVGSLGKMARDIALMGQAEIAEVAEPAAPGRGNSSSMPQKQNPVGCAVALAAATRVPALVSILLSAMPQEHERGLGGWHAEWETLPEIFLLSAGALFQMRHVIEGLHVDAERMRANLDATRGMVYAGAVSMALAAKIGRSAAHQLVERVCRRAADEGRHLREAAAADSEISKHLSGAELQSLFDPSEHDRAASRLVDRALADAETIASIATKEDS